MNQEDKVFKQNTEWHLVVTSLIHLILFFYRRAIRSHEPDHDDENQIKDEDRFRQCQKFEVTCNCGEKIVLDSITRGSGKDLQLALLHCPNVSCQRSPLLEKFTMIKNKLGKLIF